MNEDEDEDETEKTLEGYVYYGDGEFLAGMVSR